MLFGRTQCCTEKSVGNDDFSSLGALLRSNKEVPMVWVNIHENWNARCEESS